MQIVLRLKSILQTPALRAFVLQVVSFFLTLISATAIELLFGRAVPLPVWALLQGAFAAALSRVSGLAWWWIVIQFLFPGALLAAQAIHIPPIVFLCAFLLLLALYWTTFRTQVPFFPSTRATWNAVAGLLPRERPIRFIDIGSGFGGLVIHLAARRPESSVAGVEVAPLPWLISVLWAAVARSKGHFLRRDYLGLNFADYDVVFAFLSPAAMPSLWAKAQREMRAGSVLISYEFPIPGAEPNVIFPQDNRGACLYVWYM